MRTRPLFALMIMAVAAVCVAGQTLNPEKGEVIKVNTQLVEVPVIITDKAGKPILNLKQQNFSIFEDGKVQDILEFNTTTAPFEVALLLDTSGSTRSDLALIQRSAASFIDSLRPGDRVAIIAFNENKGGDRSMPALSEVVTPLTDNREQLRDALQHVGTSNGTPYYDGLVQIADKIFSRPTSAEFQGRRALVALTDGVDSTSLADFGEAQEKLEKDGVISFFIQVNTRPFFEENLLGDCASAIRFSQAQMRRYYKTFGSADIGRADNFCKLGDFERLDISKRLYDIANTEMGQLAKTSGGKVFPVGDLSEARSAFKNVADEIGTKYSLGYYSSNEKRDGTYRKIRVELKGTPPGVTVRAREGYTAPLSN